MSVFSALLCSNFIDNMATAMATCASAAIAQSAKVPVAATTVDVRSCRAASCLAPVGLRISPDCAELQRAQSHKVAAHRRALVVTSEATKTKTPKTPGIVTSIFLLSFVVPSSIWCACVRAGFLVFERPELLDSLSTDSPWTKN